MGLNEGGFVECELDDAKVNQGKGTTAQMISAGVAPLTARTRVYAPCIKQDLNNRVTPLTDQTPTNGKIIKSTAELQHYQIDGRT